MHTDRESKTTLRGISGIERPSSVTVRAVDHRVADAVLQGYKVTSCRNCDGSVVHSKPTIRALCFGCGRRYLDGHIVEACWRCATWFRPDNEQLRLIVVDGANGRLSMEQWPTCGCEQDASAAPSVVRRSTWRRCAVCGARLTSTANRTKYCASCAKRKRRELNRAQARAYRRQRQRFSGEHR